MPARRAFDDPTPRAPVAPRGVEDLRGEDLLRLVVEDETRIEGLELHGTLPPGVVARNVTIEETRVRGSLAGAKLHDLHLHDAELVGADLANVDLAKGHVDRVVLQDCRLTGAQLIETTIKDATFTGCRIDFAVLAAARLDRVLFRGCDLREVSLEQAQLRDVRFESCDLSRATLDQSRHQRVLLEGCRLEGVRSLQDLRGIAMPWPDIVDQAGALAAALGIAVARDPDEDEESLP
ncbi:MAG TPA: pentapeptide repeat-containing protein [Baekduia sp.]|uniref:pentapeptide repeat-containing protein n=1 Tax=Baekduia sp. TaxID=2600305 RepID=UPI002D771ACC|nr:pentapeptide repeat-containing protein [Baekduia sp.]HET6508761.1 pentapeptide repeat-containing protein [Baekduia sp.]